LLLSIHLFCFKSGFQIINYRFGIALGEGFALLMVKCLLDIPVLPADL